MKLAVLGLGRVGLPTACYFASRGYEVYGFDADPVLNQELQQGENPLPWEAGVDPTQITVPSTLDEALSNAEIVYVIVPTPIDALSPTTLSSKHVRSVLTDLAAWSGIVIVGSTLDPRDVETVSRLHGGFVYNPPLIRLGHVVDDLRCASVGLVGCHDDSRFQAVVDLWGWHDSHVPVIRGTPLDIAVAKLAINTTLSMRIAWANEIDVICRTVGADPRVVLGAVRADPRIGPGCLYPGYPPSGPCLPRDLDVWVSSSPKSPLAKTVAESHRIARHTVIGRVEDVIGRKFKDPSVAVLGLTYNPMALDITLSQGYELMRRFVYLGWKAWAYDPAASHFYFPFPVTATAFDAVARADVVVLSTPWPEFLNLDLSNKHVIDLAWSSA